MKSNTKLRQESLKKVISLIRERGPISKRELQRITGFSWGNISSIMTLLCETGFITCAGKQDTGLGRKPEEFDINTENNYIIGVDFNCVYIMAAVCDLRGRIIASFKNEFSNKSCVKKDDAVENLYKTVGAAVDFCKGKTLTHIAVAMQGDVDAVGGISVSLSTIENWKNIPVCKILEDKFSVKTIMFHDPDCVLYAERFFGVLGNENAKNAVEIIFSHGMGMAALLEGRIYMGNKGKSCEIKDLAVPSDKHGYTVLTNVMGSMSVIASNYNKITGKKVDEGEVAGLARMGDKTAVSLFKEAVKAFAFALVNINCLFNPDVVVLFGDFAKYSDLIVDGLNEAIGGISGTVFEPEIKLSTLDYTATAVGAALFAADIAIKQLYFE